MAPVDHLPTYTIRQLAAFVAVAERGTISGAAEGMHLSQSALAAAVTDLEKALKVQLTVRRRARGVQLTDAGERVLDRARDLLRRAGALQTEAAEVAQGVDGVGADGDEERRRRWLVLTAGIDGVGDTETADGARAFLTRLAMLLSESVSATEFDRCVDTALGDVQSVAGQPSNVRSR